MESPCFKVDFTQECTIVLNKILEIMTALLTSINFVVLKIVNF